MEFVRSALFFLGVALILLGGFAGGLARAEDPGMSWLMLVGLVPGFVLVWIAPTYRAPRRKRR